MNREQILDCAIAAIGMAVEVRGDADMAVIGDLIEDLPETGEAARLLVHFVGVMGWQYEQHGPDELQHVAARYARLRWQQ